MTASSNTSALTPDDAQMMITLHGNFPCSTQPAGGIEGLIAAHVQKRHIRDVSDAYAHRWWDYRLMAPGHSFMLFAHHYYSLFKVYAKQLLAHRRTRHSTQGVGAIGMGEFYFTAMTIWERDRTHISGMWNAMLTADALGIPYDHYIRLAFQIAIDTAWKRLPRPNQLYSDKMAAQVLYAWQQLCKDRFIYAKHPIYRLDRYEGAVVQDDYRDWLKDQLYAHRGNPRALAQVVYQAPQLPEADAAQMFSDYALTRAKRLTV